MLGVDWEFSCCRNRLSKIHWFLRCLKMTLRNFKTLKRFQSLWPCLPPFLGLSTGCWDGARQKQETMCPLTLATSDSPCYDSSWAWIFCPEFWQNSGKGSRFYDGDCVFFFRKDLWGKKTRGGQLGNFGASSGCSSKKTKLYTESWRFKGHEVFKLFEMFAFLRQLPEVQHPSRTFGLPRDCHHLLQCQVPWFFEACARFFLEEILRGSEGNRFPACLFAVSLV